MSASHDGKGFFKPSSLGFPEVTDDNLKMSMFPLPFLFPVSQGEIDKNKIRKKILEMENIHYMMNGEKFKTMPGITWCTSLGSPPTPLVFDSTQELYSHAEIKTPNQWVQKYFIGQIANTIAHCFFTDPISYSDYEASANYFIDVTESSLLARDVKVIPLLRMIQYGSIPVSLMESESNRGHLEGRLQRTIQRLITKIQAAFATEKEAEEYSESLWMVFIFCILSVFRYEYKLSVKNNVGHESVEDYDYPVRFYLVKRRARFLYDRTERGTGEGKVPVGEMNALIDEVDLTADMWLSISQYLRLLTLVQGPFRLTSTVTVKPLQRIIFRDPHACTTSSISSRYDSIFFGKAEKYKQTTIMLGINPAYKLLRHARMKTFNLSWVNPPSTEEGIFNSKGRYSSHSFGVLAGVCWFYNPDTTKPLLDPVEYRTILYPFTLTLDEDELPKNLVGPERTNVLSLMKGFFTYGVDEYVLSKFMIEHINNAESMKKINLLFFTIHWIRAICGTRFDSPFEYYPLTSFFLSKIVPEGPMTFGDFVRNIMVTGEKIGLQHTYIHTMFGNIENASLESSDVHEIVKSQPLDIVKKAGDNFMKMFPQITTGPGNINMSCLLDYVHRYDRPAYWMSWGREQNNVTKEWKSLFSPRAAENPDGSPVYIVPNNRSNDPSYDLAFAIKWKIKNPACVGHSGCPENADERVKGKCVDKYNRTISTWGGARKTKKTQKQKRKE